MENVTLESRTFDKFSTAKYFVLLVLEFYQNFTGNSICLNVQKYQEFE